MNRVLVVLATIAAILGRRPRAWGDGNRFTDASNVIPYMGFAAAMLGGLAHALLAEDIHPLIPLVSSEAIWVVAAVVLAELLKDALHEPIVLGGTVQLHPLAVVTGLVGGARLSGPAGMFLAIPTIPIVKVLRRHDDDSARGARQQFPESLDPSLRGRRKTDPGSQP